MLPCLLCTPPSPSSNPPPPRRAISVGACLWFHSSSILTHARLVQLWLLAPCFCLITRASPTPSKIISCMTINSLKCNIENFSQAKQCKIANFIFNGTPSPSCTCCYRVPGTTLAGVSNVYKCLPPSVYASRVSQPLHLHQIKTYLPPLAVPSQSR